MSFNVVATELFERKVKRLPRKHKSLKANLIQVIEELKENPKLGSSIGKDCYKIRVAITSKGKGKSGGARIITYARIIRSTVFLIDIYDKTEQATITNKELLFLINVLTK